MQHDMEEAAWYAKYVRDKKYVEAALRRLCLGAEIQSLEYAGYPETISIIIGDNPYEPGVNSKVDDEFRVYMRQRPRGEGCLNIEGQWNVLPSLPSPSVEHEQIIVESLPVTATDEQLHQLLILRAERIVEARLGVVAAHLLIGFESGRALFVRGNDRYKSWQLGLSARQIPSSPDEFWLLVDMPGGDIAIWTPDSFDPEYDAALQKSASG